MALQLGDRVPDFSATDCKGNLFESTTVVGKQAVVIYFYPKDNTPGCTSQACSFRDQYEDFKDLGAEVIGISSDSVASHEEFAKQFNLPFILLSDKDKKIRRLFGVKPHFLGFIPGRTTYVVDKKGIIQLIFSNLAPKNHLIKALETIRKTTSES